MIRRICCLLTVLAITLSTVALASDGAPAGVVNVNTAGAEQLQLLPRIGPALADRIIDFRDTNGPFASIDELVAVKGIGDASLAKLEPYVTTEGETTLTTKVKLPRSSSGGADQAR
jgi:competence protein ComEA